MSEATIKAHKGSKSRTSQTDHRHKRAQLPKLHRSPHSNQTDQLVAKLRQLTNQEEITETLTQRASHYVDMRLPEGIYRLLTAVGDISFKADIAWAARILQFLSQSKDNLLDPSTARKTFEMVESRVQNKSLSEKQLTAWNLAKYNARIDYVKSQESLLRQKALKTMVDGLSGELAEDIEAIDPKGEMYGMLEDCLVYFADNQAHKNEVLYRMRSLLGMKHPEWIQSEDPRRWVDSESQDQFYLWMCDKFGERVQENLLKLIGEWNKQGLLKHKSNFSHVTIRTLIKTLMDRKLYTHAVMVSQKNAHLMTSNPVPFLLSQHKMYNMAGPIQTSSESESLEYLCSVVEKNVNVKSGRLFDAAIKAIDNHGSSSPDKVSYIVGVAISRARQQHQVALLLALAEKHPNLEVPPSALLDAASYWTKHNIDMSLTLFRAFCRTPQPTEHANFSKSTKWKNNTTESLSNLIGKLTGKHKAWENPKRLGAVFQDLNSLPDHALRAHFPAILKLYRKVAHSVSQDYVGYTLDGADFKIITEVTLLTRLSLLLRRQIAQEDKQLYYMRKKMDKNLAEAEHATRLLTQMRVKLARKLTGLTKEIARRQLVVDIALAQNICRVLNDGSLYTSSLNAWRTYLCLSGIVPSEAYKNGDSREVYLFESPNSADVDCSFLVEGNEEIYKSRHVSVFTKPAGSLNTLKTLDSIVVMMDELTRIGGGSSESVHTRQCAILNDLFARATSLLETVRNPVFKIKHNQLVMESYIRAAAHYNPAGAVSVFANINMSSSDGSTWAAVLSSCIDEDVKAVYRQACDRKLSNQTDLHNIFIQRSIKSHDWDSVGSGIENLFSYGKFPSQKTMNMILANSGDIDINDLLVEITQESIPVYNKETSLAILKVLASSTSNPNTAIEYYKNLEGCLGFSGLTYLSDPISKVDPETASSVIPKLLALVNSEVPLEYLTALLPYSSELIFDFACETKQKNTLQGMSVESVEAFVAASLNHGISPYLVYRFLMDLKSVATSCISVSALKTVLHEMSVDDAKQAYKEFVEEIAKDSICIDKLWVAKDLLHPSYGYDIKPLFEPARLQEISDRGDHLIPSIFDEMYDRKEIPCHSVFYNYKTFEPDMTVEGHESGVDVSARFEGVVKQDYTKRYTHAFNCI